MTVGAFASETKVPARRVFFAHAAQIRAEFRVIGDSDTTFFEILTQAEREFFLHCWSEGDGLDFPGETFLGAFGQLRAEPGLIDARALELFEGEQTIEFGFDLSEGAIT